VRKVNVCIYQRRQKQDYGPALTDTGRYAAAAPCQLPNAPSAVSGRFYRGIALRSFLPDLQTEHLVVAFNTTLYVVLLSLKNVLKIPYFDKCLLRCCFSVEKLIDLGVYQPESTFRINTLYLGNYVISACTKAGLVVLSCGTYY